MAISNAGANSRHLSASGYPLVASSSVASYTVMAWVYAATNSAYANLFYFGGGDAAQIEPGGQWSFWNGTNDETFGAVTLNGWQHVAVVRSSATAGTGYLNGAATSLTLESWAKSSTQYVGSWDGSSDGFNGRIASVKAFNRALTAAEIAAEMQVMRPVLAGSDLYAWYPIIDRSSVRWGIDHSGNGRNLTTTGAVVLGDDPPVSWGAPVFLHPLAATAGGGTLTIGHLASSAALYAPSLVPGAVALTVPHMASTSALYAPSLGAGAALSLPHLARSATLYSPTLSPGAVAVSVPHLASSATLTAPTLASGSVALILAHLASAATLSAPTLAPGPVALTVPHLASTAALNAPSLAGDTPTITLPHLASSATLSAPALVPGSVTLSIAHLASTSTLTSPTLTSVATVAVPHLAATSTLYGPALTPGAVLVTLTHLSSASVLYALTIGEPFTGTVLTPTRAVLASDGRTLVAIAASITSLTLTHDGRTEATIG